jgi:predicted phage terminase large subunit-like protein
MVPRTINNLIEVAKEIATERYELFGCEEHVLMAMDEILPGAAYNEKDDIDTKLNKLFERATTYLEYDKIVSEQGQSGNRSIDAAKIRREIYLAHGEEFGDQLSFLKFMCQTNGLFLGREVLNRTFTWFTHGPAFDLFVQKNPVKVIAVQDPIYKIRLLLMPRGSYKSTADGVDCAQWIINFPDIRIMFLTASLELAKMFVSEVKGYFTTRETNGLTPLQAIIGPEFHVPEGDEGKENEFICPCRTKGDQAKKEVTLWAGSVGSSKVGMHCEMMKADDAVDDKNTETPQLITKTNRRIGMALNLLDAGTYNDNLGTPYAPNDWYAHVSKNIDNVLTVIRPAKWLRKDINGATAIDRGAQEKDLTDNDWTYLFPADKYGHPKLDAVGLRRAYQRDPEGFASQYLLNYAGYKKVTFPQELIESRSITPAQMPEGWESFTKYVTWDFADTATSVSDFSVGTVFAVSREGVAYVIDIYRDRYASYSQLCYAVAEANHKYRPSRVIIEDARGASKLRGDIVRAALDMGDREIPLDFVKVTNTKSAKAIRIGKLEPKMRTARLFILNTVSCYEDLVQEFVNFGSAAHDDIPDSMGFCEHFLEDARSAPTDLAAVQRAQAIMDAKSLNDMIYNSSPEDYIDKPLEPLPGTGEPGTGNDEAGDLWNPFGTTTFKR